jgi:hypothetical protein
MDMDQAAVFLAGSVLIMMGFVVIVIGVVAINNVIHRYWKPVRIFTADSWSVGTGSARFAEPHELDKSQEPKVK